MPDNSLLGDINEELEDTQKNIGLLDFDKFNILDKGVTEGQADDEITKALTDELEKQQEIYNQISTSIKDMSNDAVKIGENIRNWFIETDAEGNFEKWTTQAKGLLAVITAIGLAKIFTIGSNANIFKGLNTAILEVMTSVKGLTTQTTLLGKAFTFIQTHPIILAIIAIVAVMTYLYATNEKFRESINQLSTTLFTLLGTVLEPILKLINTLMPIVQVVVDLLANILIPIIDNINALLTSLTGIIEIITNIISFFVDLVGTQIEFLSDIFKAFALLLKGDVKGAAEIVKNVFENTWKSIANGFANMINGIVNGFVKLVNGIVDGLNAILSPISKVSEFFGGEEIKIPHWEFEMNWQPYAGSFANGGVIPNKGSIFQAGEAGTELVYNMGGSTGVANIEQLQQAVFNGTMQAILATGLNDPTNINVNLDSDLDGFARLLTPRINIEKARGGYR